MKDSDDAVLVELDIPGFSPEELEITFKENILFISGTRTMDKEAKTREARYLQKETGSFTRTIPIHYKIEGDGISAKYTKGRLCVLLPKIKEKPSTIKVKVQ